MIMPFIISNMYLINIIVTFNLKRNWILLFAEITNFDYDFMSCTILVIFIPLLSY